MTQENPLEDIRIGEQVKMWAEANKIPAQYWDTCESTSDLAKKEAFAKSLDKTPLKLYLTDLQTKGRGRGGNTWNCPVPGPQLLMTWSFRLPEVPWPTLSPRLGLALWTAARGTWSFLPWSLKAPNDLYLGKKKVAGILLENVIQGEDKIRTLVGIGMNILDAPSDVLLATSLLSALPEGVPLLADDLFQFLDRLSLEIGQAMSIAPEGLSSTDQANVLMALNQFLEIAETPAKKYTKIDENGNLWQGKTKTPWMEL